MVMLGSRVFPVVGRAAPNLQYGNMLAEFKQKARRRVCQGAASKERSGEVSGTWLDFGFYCKSVGS